MFCCPQHACVSALISTSRLLQAGKIDTPERTWSADDQAYQQAEGLQVLQGIASSCCTHEVT